MEAILTNDGPKVSILNDNENCATFIIQNEDHTIGNALSSDVDFAAYSIPHPSETQINLRIQTNGACTPSNALKKGLDDLEAMYQHIHDEFVDSIAAKNYEIMDGAEPNAQ